MSGALFSGLGLLTFDILDWKCASFEYNMVYGVEGVVEEVLEEEA